MWADRNRSPLLRGIQKPFEAGNHFRGQHMFNPIRIAIDFARGKLRVRDQIQLPKPMLVDQSRCHVLSGSR
jgi:hypothetical protein